MQVPRGSIISSDNKVLAESVKQGKFYRRSYPLGRYASHLVGYNSIKLGSAGMESYLNRYLSGNLKSQLPARFFGNFINNEFLNSDVAVTIDSELQKAAAVALGNRKGAVVVLNPKNGAILAAYSYPDYDPGSVEENWNYLLNDKSNPLLFRATQGLYPPGSLMKIVTMAAALKSGISKDSTWSGPGFINISGGKLTNFKDQSSGKMSMSDALVKSSNTVFGQIAIKIGEYSFFKQAESFGFNAKPVFDFVSKTSRLPVNKNIDDLELAWSAVGQGRVLATPLEMALMASAVANDGKIQLPHLLREVRQLNGNLVYSFKNKVWLTPISKLQSDIIKNSMVQVVESGTGKAAAIKDISVAGKTGTAEVGKGIKPHAWFAGFAPAENPKIVVAVVVENGGLGGKVAAPIAQKIIKKALF